MNAGQKAAPIFALRHWLGGRFHEYRITNILFTDLDQLYIRIEE